ncbi:MAG: DNA repair protein RadC [Chloroflexota bacterium]|nr:DNA repair protein RadC [Chloroflexota bacterium]
MTTWPVADSPRARLVRSGGAACSVEELLSVLVSSQRSRGRDTARVLADRLLVTAGGLGGLAAASVHDLRAVPGVGELRAASVVAALELGRRAVVPQPATRWQVRTPADVAVRLVPEMGHLEREELRVVLLNTRNVVVSCGVVYLGNLAGSLVRVGEVFRDAVRRNAASVMVIHNHPSGDPAPSGDDLRITREMADAGRLLDIDLLDHLIIGHDRWVSLRALGALGT